MNSPVLKAIWSRRVSRYFTEEPVSKADLETIVEAARWAPSGGNRRLHKYLVIESQSRIDRIRCVSPGMLGRPTALVVVCTDWQKADRLGLQRNHVGTFIDVGTATQNMLLAAHVLGLGAGPVTSFSKVAVSVLLELPEWLSPELIICLGHTASISLSRRTKTPKPLTWQDLTIWEKYEGKNASGG